MIANPQEILEKAATLGAARISLRRFTEDDAADILEFGSDAETLKFLVWDGVSTLEEARATVDSFYNASPGRYCIEHKQSKKCIGAIDIRPDCSNEKAGFGYVLNRAYWGQGYMTEALTALLSFAFDTLELNRVESYHYAGNPASGRVMQKCGMVREGILIQEYKVKGIFQDCVHYGITLDMWNKR